MRLKNKVAIITGASQGIGKGIAETFGTEGAKIVIADIDEELGSQTVNEFNNKGIQSIFQQTDVGDEASVIELMKRTSEEFGKIDILVNNAGISIRKAVHETSIEEWQKLINTNLTGAFLCSKHVIPEMKKQESASIINMSSWHAEKTITRFAAYATAKGGLAALTRQMALDYGKDQIRVNAVGPGMVDTPSIHQTFESLGNKEEAFKQTKDYNPMNRIADVQDIANACLFFASDESKYISGQTIVVDGGQINKMARPLLFD